MITPKHTITNINAGETKIVSLPINAMYINNTIAISQGTSGIVTFKVKVLFGQWEIPESPNSIDLTSHKSISFNGASLEAIEITNTSEASITIAITQY